MLKLNTKGFAHWAIPMVVVVLVGAIGTYTLQRSHAAALYPTAANCGGGYTKLASYGFTTKNVIDIFPAHIDVYYNSALKRACAFNVAEGSANGGVAKPMSVTIGVEQTQSPFVPLSSFAGASSSKGSFTRWAGPVYVNYGPIHTKYPHIGISLRAYGKTTYNGKTGSSDGSTRITAKMY